MQLYRIIVMFIAFVVFLLCSIVQKNESTKPWYDLEKA